MDDYEHLMLLAVPVLEKQALTVAELRREDKKVDPEPSDAQKESGVYSKGHVRWNGLDITIETAKGQYRRGVSADGKPWKTLMKRASYGYVRGSTGKDGDHVDVFLSSDEDLRSELVFVINQVDPATRKFNEHKCILGCVDEESARRCYLANYEEGWQGLGSITPLTLPQFKWWLEHGNTKAEIKDWYFAAPENRKKAAESAYELNPDTSRIKYWCRRCHEPWKDCTCPGKEKEAEAYLLTVLPTKTASDSFRIIFIKRAEDDETPFTVAVDLDGTLAEQLEPFDPDKIGKPRDGAKKWLERFRDAGARVIVFTVRDKNTLVRNWLTRHSIPFDYVNFNPDQPPNSSGKIFAHAYLDDRGVSALDFDEGAAEVLRRIEEDGENKDRVEPVTSIIIERLRIQILPEQSEVESRAA